MYHALLTAAPTRFVRAAVVVAGALVLWPALALAQGESASTKAAAAAAVSADKQDDASDMVHNAMSRNMTEGLHVKLTPRPAGTHADTVRAGILAESLRAAIGKYQDTAAAVADGFRMFAPQLKEQAVYHFTNWSSAVKAAFRFDPSKPTSLLYVKKPSGEFKLIGAMYTAPARTSDGDLDKRVPLSVARWHRHVNLCLTQKGEERRYAEQKDGKLLFGPEGTIATEKECKAANGRWYPTLFGWMVHANVFAGGDFASVWGSGEGHEH